MPCKFAKYNAYSKRAHGPLINLVSDREDVADFYSFRFDTA